MGRNRYLNDYAVNNAKANKKAIVYQSPTGRTYIRQEDIAAENPPGYCEATFSVWKEISNNDYLDIENADHTEARHCFLVDDYSLYQDKTAASYGEKVRQKALAEALDKALALLTPTQQRRLLLYHVDKKPLRKIAEEECVDHKVVQRSIIAAEKKIRDYFNTPKP